MDTLLIITSIVFLSIGVWILKGASLGVFGRTLASLFVVVMLSLTGVYLVSSYFTGSGIDESVLYHLQYGLAGAGFEDYWPIISFALLAVVFAVVSGFVINKYLSPGGSSSHAYLSGIGSIALLVSLFFNPASKDLQALLMDAGWGVRGDISAETPEGYVIPQFDAPDDPYNIVFIYLESLEKTYFDESRFPGLLPGLKELSKEAIRFDGVEQLWGTGWTIAGMTASQCGVPLVTASGGNSMSGMDAFLPGAACLGDLLSDSGYRLSYLGGASLDFAGKGKFYSTHGFERVRGREELAPFVERDYFSPWGLYDDSLFALALEQVKSYEHLKDPFGVFLLTLDTHHPKGHPSASCNGLKYGDGSNEMLNAVHCSDRLVTEFVRDLRGRATAEKTIIVLASDHLAMRNTASGLLEQEERTNLFMVLHPEPGMVGTIERAASLFDVGPTVLSLMGFDVPALGLGRDLRRDVKTFVEEHDNPNRVLIEGRPFYTALWEFPQLHAGIRIDGESRMLRLGDRDLGLPVLLRVDDDGRVDQVWFETSSPKRLPEYVEGMSAGARVVWVDTCRSTSALTADSKLLVREDLCLAAGRLGNDGHWLMEPVNDDQYFSEAELRAVLDKDVDAKAMEEQKARLISTVRYGTWRYERVVLREGKEGESGKEFFLTSVGGYQNGPSRISSQGEPSNSGITARRGLTLFGLGAGPSPVKLAHVDSCGGTVEDIVGLDGTFADALEQAAGAYGAYAIIAHDSAVCSDAKRLNEVLHGLPLEKWSDLGFREPYIGLISMDGQIYEARGESEESISVHVVNVIDKSTDVRIARADRPGNGLKRIAHAGGGYDGRTYTNSLDALNHNRTLYELFEIDFSWTSDGHLVCLHDWDRYFAGTFGFEVDNPLSLEEFQRSVSEKLNFQKCTLSSLVNWLRMNDGVRIVTDVKRNNVKALELIAEKYPGEADRFVAQVHSPDEYRQARSLGFEDIIWTLYRYRGDDDSVVAEAEYMNVYAITMPRSRADRGLAHRLQDIGIRTYVHTVNEHEEFERYRELGVGEIYTDWLRPDDGERGEARAYGGLD